MSCSRRWESPSRSSGIRFGTWSPSMGASAAGTAAAGAEAAPSPPLGAPAPSVAACAGGSARP
eukprot:8948921-Pyramimonas_sp.AAC.1